MSEVKELKKVLSGMHEGVNLNKLKKDADKLALSQKKVHYVVAQKDAWGNETFDVADEADMKAIDELSKDRGSKIVADYKVVYQTGGGE